MIVVGYRSPRFSLFDVGLDVDVGVGVGNGCCARKDGPPILEVYRAGGREKIVYDARRRATLNAAENWTTKTP